MITAKLVLPYKFRGWVIGASVLETIEAIEIIEALLIETLEALLIETLEALLRETLEASEIKAVAASAIEAK